MDPQWLGKKLVNHTLRIGQKENAVGAAKAVKRYGSRARAVLGKKVSYAEAKRRGIAAMMDDLCGVDYGPLFLRTGKGYSPKTKIGQSVLISFNPANRAVADSVRKAALSNGAHVLMNERSTSAIRDVFSLAPIGALAELSPISRALHETIDYSINIESIENEFWKSGISPAKIKAGAPASQKLHEIMDSREERWCLVGWPHPEIAKELGLSKDRFERIVFGSIEESFNPALKKLTDAYYRTLKGAKTIRIIHEDGTDLTFSVRGRDFLRDDGILDDGDIARGDVGMNIPCGEIFTAPIEQSAEGVLKIPKNIIPGHGVAEGITLRFQRGKVVGYSAEKHEEYLDRFFAENTGEARRIAEFGIGCNSRAEDTNGYIIVDEKILGTLHIAIGWNIGYGGKNNASSHLDFIKPMANGRVYADGRLVMDKGRLVRIR